MAIGTCVVTRSSLDVRLHVSSISGPIRQVRYDVDEEDAAPDDALLPPGARRPLGHHEEEDDQETRKGGAHDPQP
jgi:hypothetical protein